MEGHLPGRVGGWPPTSQSQPPPTAGYSKLGYSAAKAPVSSIGSMIDASWGIPFHKELSIARTLVPELDFLTTSGAHTTSVITDLGVLEPRDGELTLTALHPGVGVDEVRAATGWDLRVADPPARTPEPTDRELAALRELVAR